jgi:hypothetical protein
MCDRVWLADFLDVVLGIRLEELGSSWFMVLEGQSLGAAG